MKRRSSRKEEKGERSNKEVKLSFQNSSLWEKTEENVTI